MRSTAGIPEALDAIRSGRMVIVADDEDRENEGDLVMAAESIDVPQMAFYLRHGSGIVCTPLPDFRADALHLDPMVDDNTDLHRTAFTVSVDSIAAGTGISATDRVRTVRAVAADSTLPQDLRRPGHIFPLRSRAGGVLKRSGHTEATVDLLSMAGCRPVGVITELVGDDGVPTTGDRLWQFADHHAIPLITISDLVRFRRETTDTVAQTGSATLPTEFGVFDIHSFTSLLDDAEHFVLSYGDVDAVSARGGGVLVRVHSECVTGDVLNSRRCDCGTQLRAALHAIVAEGAGLLVYLRGHEGRGIGLGHKLRAYRLQENGSDTVDANIALGLPIDSREYGIGAAMLRHLGVTDIRLITNNPAKIGGISGFGLKVISRVSSPSAVTAENITYLRTKRDRLGHMLDLPGAAET